MSERKNFRKATIVNATAKKQSSSTSTADWRNVSPKVIVSKEGGCVILTVSSFNSIFGFIVVSSMFASLRLLDSQRGFGGSVDN